VSKKLLLADDSVTIQRVIELTFADEDIDVIAVGDGRQAIDRLEREPPDIVLADVGMPQHDGYEVATYIKSKPHLAHIPVILLAGAFDPIDEARAKAAGCDGVMAKPFEPQQVIARVRELLGRRKTGPDAPTIRTSILGDTKESDKAPRRDAASPAGPDAPAGAPSASLDEYFDRLDLDLNLAASVPPPAGGRTGSHEGSTDFDWLPKTAESGTGARSEGSAFGKDANAGATADSSRVSVHADWFPPPAASSSAQADEGAATREGRPEDGSHSDSADRAHPATYAGPAPGTLAGTPSLADAFAALLAAEQGAPAAAVPLVPERLDDETLELIVARVIERMSRDTVSDVVARVAERLVREEIERIKNAG
jgi:CheY-like chemotaxis protein